MRILIGVSVIMMMKNNCGVSATMSLLGKINSDPSILGKNHFEPMNYDVSMPQIKSILPVLRFVLKHIFSMIMTKIMATL